MEVRILRWQEIPKDSWQEILKMIPIGGYVESLPYAVPEHLKSFRIALPSPCRIAPYTDSECSSISLKILEFEKVTAIRYVESGGVIDGTYGKSYTIFRRLT